MQFSSCICSLVGATSKGEVRCPDKGDNMPHGQSQPQRHGEADQVGGAPNAEDVVDVLVPVLGVVSNAVADPSTGIPGVAEHARLKNVEGWQVDAGQHAKVQGGLSSEGHESRAIP
eukprot:Skav207969  [mRNA]  locus=scaffold495:33522:36319:- [translate_table: standard]